jgi:hypothetical protein
MIEGRRKRVLAPMLGGDSRLVRLSVGLEDYRTGYQASPKLLLPSLMTLCTQIS